MSTAGYPSSAHASSSYVDQGRPKSIAELAAIAQHNLWDPNKPLKHWLRTAEKARKVGQSYVDTRNFEAAFIEFARAATIVLEKLPTHQEYHVLLNADQRANLGMNGQDILDGLSKLKPYLVERYETYRARHGADDVVSQTAPEDPARRRREDLARAQEEERVRQALEAAHIEDEWRREDTARREAEELQRRVQEERDWARQAKEARQRDTSEAQRAAEAREAAEQERLSSRYRAGEDVRRAEERRRLEQEGILQRQQEAEAAALATRRQIASTSGVSGPSRTTPEAYYRRSQEPDTQVHAISVATPQPSRPPSSSQQRMVNVYNSGPPTMPVETPMYADDSDVDGKGVLWNRTRQVETPTKAKHLNPGLAYPPPITTTSPAPPELGPIRYPTLMSQHQLKQGYVPSLQSMFSHPANEPPRDSAALLLETKPSGPLYSNLLPKPSTPGEAVIPPYVPGMPLPDRYQHSYDHRSQRGPSPSTSRLPAAIPPPPPLVPAPAPAPTPARIVRGASTESDIKELKSVRLPRECLPRFLSIARVNTSKNKETCGLLLGKDKGSKYVVTTLLIPKQHSTSDTCTMDEEELVLQFTEERHLITLGWIHTHPTQSCFMSSVDLHTHSGFQRMLPESFAVVCAPSSTPTFGIFRLTDPGGLQVILDCQVKEAFHPHPEVPIYTDCDNCHVQMKDISLEIVDLRES